MSVYESLVSGVLYPKACTERLELVFSEVGGELLGLQIPAEAKKH